MIGDDVELSFSPGGRYLTIGHHSKNRFFIISIADLGDPLGEEDKIADIALGRIVQATPSKFNSHEAYWGKTPTDIHDLTLNQTMAQLFDLEEQDDVSTTLYFLSDRDILTDVTSPWGYRQRMPNFVDSYAVYALPLQAKDMVESPKGQFRGNGAEELQVDSLLERHEFIQAFLDAKKAAGATTTARREKRKLAESIHPLAGAFGYAERAFYDQKRRQLDGKADEENTDDTEVYDEDDNHLKEAVFGKDMDIDFGAVDLTFARRAYRISSIPAGDYNGIVCQCPDGSLTLLEDGHLAIFEAEGFPSDQYEKKTFMATSRKIVAALLSSNRKFVVLIYAPDGAIRVVANSKAGMAELQSDLELDDNVVDKDGMHLSIWPTLEYRQLYDDAWRMLRDYFYDPDMTGIDWPAIHERFLPLVERCSKREELDDVLMQMSSELSALHVFVYGGEYGSPMHGDTKLGSANEVGSLGAILKRTPAWKGYTVMSIPEADPDFTMIDHSKTFYSPLSDQSLRLSGQRGLEVGDVIVGVNGESVMTVPDIHMLLRGTAGRSVRLDVLRLASGATTDALVTDENSSQEEEEKEEEATIEALITVPLSPSANSDLLYHAWEWKTEQLAEQLASEAGISVGYVHLQDMSGAEAEDAFARGFFPSYNKQGFILDVRHNRGGNIDSWVLDVLQRKAWMYWKSRDFDPESGGIGWDEHYAFRGHLIVLLDEKTSSDGEGVSRGISELGLGKLIGTRTWGGGIWLSSDNKLVDGGIATAPEIGDYNDKFGWGMGIENMGVEPDIVVDNDPHDTYLGKDKQLERAIEELKKWIELEPVAVPKPKSKRKDVTMGERECKA
jgi:C-terminal processing protease CtpA/Prc